ncbi:hypothetical protein Ancab_024458 [Ancistrocladus abbreviatus]
MLHDCCKKSRYCMGRYTKILELDFNKRVQHLVCLLIELHTNCRFPEVAELITVCWLDIRGKMKMSMLSARTNYAVYFVFKLTEEVFGFHDPAEVSVGIARGKTETRSVFLDPDEDQRQMFFPIDTHIPSMPRRGDDQYPKQRSDGWLETKMGEFFVEEDDNGEVELSVLEIKGGDWKGGLIVEGFEIRTKAAE